MTTHPYELPQDIYDESLKTIRNVSFTRREIDTIACLLSGRTTQSIASFLLISPRGVESHLRNIGLKLGTNSKERIRNWIEKSDKAFILTEYYRALRALRVFEEHLRIVAKKKVSLNCLMVFCYNQKKKTSLIKHIENHFKIAGIITAVEARESFHDIFYPNFTNDQSISYTLYVLDEAFLMKCQDKTFQEEKKVSAPTFHRSYPDSSLYLFLPREPTIGMPQEISNAEYIDANAQENYYFFFFEILKRILPLVELEVLIADFKREYEIIFPPESKNPHPPSKSAEKIFPSSEETKELEPPKNHLILTFFKKPRWLWVGAGVLSLIGILALFLIGMSTQSGNKYIETQFLGSDLPMSAQLIREKLIQQIDNKLTGSDIQTIALIGMGGSGKTTLARQYAHFQKKPVIWEINAETKTSISNSFEALAYAFCKTDEEKRYLMSLKGISNLEEREGKIIQLIRDHLKSNPHWILIYDNMERFSDIQKYFPSDKKFWGSGKIIVTTRDTHIQNNSYIKQILWIGELKLPEKLLLFKKIMGRKNTESANLAQEELDRKFLEKIPSFPLDVSIAAYYLKTTNIDYGNYLKYLDSYSGNFSGVQENILQESTGYTKTRYRIVTLSLDKLLAVNKDFCDLLVLISLLNSQNIPKELLVKFKNDEIVGDFIYQLKKHSLISDEQSPFSSNPSFTIHRSTQSICLSYLTKMLKLETNFHTLFTIAAVLDDYIEEMVCRDDLDKMKSLVKHYESFLDHNNLLTNDISGSLETDLGYIYSSLGYFVEAKQVLENGLKNLDENNNYAIIARNIVYQGWINSLFNNYDHAKKLLEQSLIIYTKYAPSKKKERARALVFLGDIYRWTGNYEKARSLLEESLSLYKETASEAHTAMALSTLGHVYEELGQYVKAISLLEQNLNFCKKHLTEDSTRQAWGLVHLGKAYAELGCYSKAAELVDQSIFILKKHFPKNHGFISTALIMLGKIRNEQGDLETAKDILELSLKNHKNFGGEWHTTYAWGLESLGDVYRKLRNYEKAKQLLFESIVIFEKQGGKDHLKTAKPLRSLGQVYLFEGDLEKAEALLQKSLKILQNNNHPFKYAPLESLSELYLKKAGSQQVTKFKTQAMDYLKQALETTKTNFPIDSPHIHRIEVKMRNLSR